MGIMLISMVGGHRCRNQHHWCDAAGMGDIIVILFIRADVPYYGHILVVEMLRRRDGSHLLFPWLICSNRISW